MDREATVLGNYGRAQKTREIISREIVAGLAKRKFMRRYALEIVLSSFLLAVL